MNRQPVVLVVASDGLTRLVTANGLAMYGFEVLSAKDGAEAIAHLEARRVAVVVTDADLGGEIDGMAVAKHARGLSSKTDVIYTSRAPYRIPEKDKVTGAPCIRTPFHPQQIVGIISELKQRSSASSELLERRVA